MKYAKLKKYNFNLQFFTNGDTGNQPDAGEDAGAEEEDEDEKGGENDEQNEKAFSQKDIDDAVKDKLAKEKRKWIREQAKASQDPSTKLDGKDTKDTKNQENQENDENQKLKEKAEELELKWVCLEHGVEVSNVDDVLALARVYLAKDKDLDIEDAIDNVLKKYPSFKIGVSEDEGTEKKGWGHRPGKSTKKSTTVEDAIREQLFGK